MARNHHFSSESRRYDNDDDDDDDEDEDDDNNDDDDDDDDEDEDDDNDDDDDDDEDKDDDNNDEDDEDEDDDNNDKDDEDEDDDNNDDDIITASNFGLRQTKIQTLQAEKNATNFGFVYGRYGNNDVEAKNIITASNFGLRQTKNQTLQAEKNASNLGFVYGRNGNNDVETKSINTASIFGWHPKKNQTLQVEKNASILGFVYGRDGNKLPSVKQTIKHYKQNKVFKMWLPKPYIEVLDALLDSELEVTISIPNSDLRSLATNPATANSWVRKHILNYSPGIKFKYICVGNEALHTTYSDHLLPAMRNINDAIQVISTDGIDMIKVSTTVGISDLDSFDPTSPPSTCSFDEKITENLEPILEFLDSNKTPLFVNILPHSVRVDNPREPALPHYLFTTTDSLMTDGKYEYTHVFDCIVDGFYSAMAALNMHKLKIVVAATGWPRSGGRDATAINAKKYNCNLLQHIRSGTPKKRRPLETYIYTMYDENYKRGSAWHKSYGVFDKDGKPYYPLF